MSEEEVKNEAVNEEVEDKEEEVVEEDPVDLISPSDEPKEWSFVYNKEERTYVQAPLSYFGKLELFQLVGTTIKISMLGENPITINSMLGSRDYDEGFWNADAMMNIVATLAAFGPDFVQDAYAIFLNVPKNERGWFREAISQSAEDGGLTDDEGLEIIEIFIDQNLATFKDFFVKRLSETITRAQDQLKQDQATAQSKRSKRTPRRTRKR